MSKKIIISVLIIISILVPVYSRAENRTDIITDTYLYDSNYQVIECKEFTGAEVLITDKSNNKYETKIHNDGTLKIRRNKNNKYITVHIKKSFFEFVSSKAIKIQKKGQTTKTLFKKIESELQNGNTTINVDGYNMSEEDYNSFMEYIVNKRPALYFVLSFRRYPGSDYIQYIDNLESDYLKKTNEFENEIRELKFYGDERNKIVQIHDYILDNVSFSKEYDFDSSSAYGAHKNGSAICQGYSAYFKALCDVNDIECKVVFSDTKDHVYNKVKLDNEWLIVDTTWDDTGEYRYRYCMTEPDDLHK